MSVQLYIVPPNPLDFPHRNVSFRTSARPLAFAQNAVPSLTAIAAAPLRTTTSVLRNLALITANLPRATHNSNSVTRPST